LIAVAGGWCAAAGAAEPAPAPQLLQALGQCRQMTDSAARLACYDQAAAALEQAVASKEVVVLDRDEVRKTRRSLFGFSLPQLPFFGGDEGDKEEEASEITTSIRSARSLGYGKWQIVLEDGAVWQTTESSHNAQHPAAGLPIRIKKGPLGSYMINVAGQRGIRAKRVG
jgi:hypothetical protein